MTSARPGLGEQHVPPRSRAHGGGGWADLAPEPLVASDGEALLQSGLADPTVLRQEAVAEPTFGDSDASSRTDDSGEIGDGGALVVEMVDDCAGVDEVDWLVFEHTAEGLMFEIDGEGDEVMTGPAGVLPGDGKQLGGAVGDAPPCPPGPTASTSAAAMPPAPEPTSTATSPGRTPSHSTIARLRPDLELVPGSEGLGHRRPVDVVVDVVPMLSRLVCHGTSVPPGGWSACFRQRDRRASAAPASGDAVTSSNGADPRAPHEQLQRTTMPLPALPKATIESGPRCTRPPCPWQ